jgi:acyl-CoA dehydrogenase
MDFALTQTQTELAALVRQIAGDHVTRDLLARLDRSGDVRFDRALWSALAGAGVLSAALPESLGGGGLGVLETSSVLIELGRAVAPVPYLTSIAVGAAALAEFGTAEQQAAFAEPAGRGELIITAALVEDLADSPVSLTSRAVADGGSWVLTGAKAVVPFGTVADLFLVPAETDDGPRVFLVAATDPGVSITASQIVDTDVEAGLDLDGVRVGAERVLGGAGVLDWLVGRTAVAISAHQFGVLQRALELTAAYAREREQFGRPIGSFQAVAQRLADAYIDVEAVRLTMWEAAWRLAEGLPASAEVLTAKFWAADAGHRVAHTAVHVHGGTGIDMDGELHRYFVTAKRNEFALGSATAQLLRLGRELADSPA